MRIASGSRLGPYEVLSPLGAGGMGEVYRARDQRLGRDVAIKVLAPEFAADDERLGRFEREARAASALNHPNILTVFDVGEHQGLPYLVTELVEGESLRERLLGGALRPRQALELALQVARGLDAAHQKGIVHRDLKPENLMVLRDGRLKILDFGLAKLRAPLSPAGVPANEAPTVAQPTEDGAILGTVGYMAPEQVRGEPADARSDLFALGCVLYEMLTGRRAFQRGSAVETLGAILRDEPPDLPSPGPPPAAASILRRCLAKLPDERFHSAHDLAFSLQEALAHEGGGAARSASTSRLSRRRLLGASVAAAAALGLIAVLMLRGGAAGNPPRGGNGQSIAVLPLANLSGESGLDYLRLALPDVIATSLSRTPQLAVRPFSRSRGMGERTEDPGAAGRELHAAVVVTGHYLLEGASLRLSLEAFDVDGDRVLWREALTVKRDDLLGLDSEVARRLDRGLIPALGLDPATDAARSVPRNREAYALFLRATALAHGQPDAIELLERSVALDPQFAPAWAELGWRRYQASHWGAADESVRRGSGDANQRALALDPNLIEAGAGLVFQWTEAGRLEAAYETAAVLVERRPDSAVAHLALAYVLRYGGLHPESLHHCATALRLDPHETRVGLCAWLALDVQDAALARRYMRTREGTEWASYVEITLLLGEGRFDEVLRVTPRLTPNPDWSDARFVEACLLRRPRRDIEPLLREVTTQSRISFDGDASYKVGALAAFCDEPDVAVRLLRQAVEQGFCAHPLLDTDPLLAKIRERPDFPALRTAAKACHERFDAYLASRVPAD